MATTTCPGTGQRVYGIRKFGGGYYPRITARCPECGKWVDVSAVTGDHGTENGVVWEHKPKRQTKR